MRGPDGFGQPPPDNTSWAAGRPVGQYPAPYPSGGQNAPAGYQPAGAPSSPYQYPAGSNQPHQGADPSVAQYNSQLDTGPTVRPIGGGGPAPTPAPGMDLAKLLGLSLAALGGLNFVLGFLPQYSAPGDYFSGENVSVFTVGADYVPILLLIAGLLALAAFLPGSERSRLAVAAVSVGGAVGAIVSLGLTGPVESAGQVTKGMGAILLVIFGIIQAVVAVGAYVVGAGIGKPSQTGADRVGPVAVASVRASGPPAGPSVPGWVGSVVAGYAPPAPAPARAAAGSAEYPAAQVPVADETPTGPQVIIGTEANHGGARGTGPQGPVGVAGGAPDLPGADQPAGGTSDLAALQPSPPGAPDPAGADQSGTPGTARHRDP